MPEVSVCVPTHNMDRYLAVALESVLAQQGPEFELVVCDDASSDTTPSICARYAGPRVRYRRFEQRGGQAGNFNRCLREARGEFLTILHADDYLLPGFLADRVARLRAHPDAGFVFGAVRVVDAEGGEVSVDRHWPEDRKLASRDAVLALLEACVVCPPSVMLRRSAADAAGPFRGDLTWGHDWEWAIRLAGTGSVLYHAQPLAAYRVHEASGTAELLRTAQNGAQERRILEDSLARLSQADPSYARARRASLRALGLRHTYHAGQALARGQRPVARYNLRFALSADPWLACRPGFLALAAESFLGLPAYRAYERVRGALRAEPAAGSARAAR